MRGLLVRRGIRGYGPSDFTRPYGKNVDAAEVLPLFPGGDLKRRGIGTALAERFERDGAFRSRTSIRIRNSV
jgi:hypothetical protein